jgi:ferrous iron transport protein A
MSFVLHFLFYVIFSIMITFADLVPGDRVRLVHFGHTDVTYRRRLLSLGITRGVELLVMRVAPLGCPVQVEVRGTSLALRKEEACHLQWERV